MKNSESAEAFSYEDALDIIEDFEDLVDTDFDIPNVAGQIAYVCIAPHDEKDKNDFLHTLRSLRDPEAAIKPYLHKTPPPEFKCEVLVIGYDNDELISFPIRAYIEMLNINYRFPTK